MELFCLLISLAILISYYRLLTTQGSDSVLFRLLSASVLTCGQIILSELVLGLFHRLFLPVLVIVNLSITVLVLVLAGRSGSVGGSGSQRDDVVRAKEAGRDALDGFAMVLGACALLAYGWILIAAYFLPTRGIDDIAYHLPAVFEYARSHEIRLLPVTPMQPFAYPENGELLFLWPVMFARQQRWVDGVNVAFVLLSVMTVYALLRHFSLPKNDSLFAALLYALCPVVLMQAGVNYVDIIVSLFLLLSLYFALRYREEGSSLDLYLAGLSIGLLCGMKYTAPFLALPLQFLILPALRRATWRSALGYLSLILLTGGWWYLRNAWVLGEPFYPMHFRSAVTDGLVNAGGGSVLQNIRYNLPYWTVRYPLSDSGVGTYDGGFGLVFWGMCCSSWIYVAVRSFLLIRSSGIPKLVALAYLPIGFLLLLAFPPRVVDFNGRLVMFVVAVGLLSFGEVLTLVGDRIYAALIKAVCIALSLVTLSLLFVSDQPSYGLGSVLADRKNHIRSSEFKYLSGSFGPHAGIQPVWELLDLLTRDGQTGMNCYIASDLSLYFPAAVYGSRLQNRVLNMEGAATGPVDAYVLTFLDRNGLDYPLPAAGAVSAPASPGTMTIEGILSKEDYAPVLLTDNAGLLLSRVVSERPEKQRILQAYYRAAWPAAVAAAEQLDPLLEADVPVIAPGGIGYGVRAVDMGKGRPERVHLSFESKEEGVASAKEMKRCYTFGRPLTGYRSQKISQVLYNGRKLGVYLNRRS